MKTKAKKFTSYLVAPRARKWILIALGIFLITSGLMLWMDARDGCSVLAGCVSGSNFCASGCCLGTTVVDQVSGCSERSWGCAENWTRSNFSCGYGCDGSYSQGSCTENWGTVVVYKWVDCEVCEERTYWEWERVCSWETECHWERYCFFGNYCEWYRVCESTKVCTWERNQVTETVCWIEQCYRYWGTQRVLAGCSQGSDSATTNCCGSGAPPPTPRPTDRPTDIPTAEPTAQPTTIPPTSTPLPTATPTVLIPIRVSLNARYSALLLYAPDVGEPTQILTGDVSGGNGGPYSLTLSVRNPLGETEEFDFSVGSNFTFDAGEAGDSYFGTDEQGTWTAWLEASDGSGGNATSPSVTWDVSWYPVHGVP